MAEIAKELLTENPAISPPSVMQAVIQAAWRRIEDDVTQKTKNSFHAMEFEATTDEAGALITKLPYPAAEVTCAPASG